MAQGVGGEEVARRRQLAAYRYHCFLTLILASLASCVSKPRAPAPPAPRPIVRPLPPPVQPAPPPAAWVDRVATPGDWSVTEDAGGSIARFGAPQIFAIRCERGARRITMTRPGTLDAGRAARLTLRSTEAFAAYPLTNSPAEPGAVAASLGVDDRLLDAIAYTRGRFLVQTEGAPDLVLPAYAEVARVIEECRR